MPYHRHHISLLGSSPAARSGTARVTGKILSPFLFSFNILVSSGLHISPPNSVHTAVTLSIGLAGKLLEAARPRRCGSARSNHWCTPREVRVPCRVVVSDLHAQLLPLNYCIRAELRCSLLSITGVMILAAESGKAESPRTILSYVYQSILLLQRLHTQDTGMVTPIHPQSVNLTCTQLAKGKLKLQYPHRFQDFSRSRGYIGSGTGEGSSQTPQKPRCDAFPQPRVNYTNCRSCVDQSGYFNPIVRQPCRHIH